MNLRTLVTDLNMEPDGDVAVADCTKVIRIIMVDDPSTNSTTLELADGVRHFSRFIASTFGGGEDLSSSLVEFGESRLF